MKRDKLLTAVSLLLLIAGAATLLHQAIDYYRWLAWWADFYHDEQRLKALMDNPAALGAIRDLRALQGGVRLMRMIIPVGLALCGLVLLLWINCARAWRAT